MPELEDLEATYGPAAPFSEYKRGKHICYISAEGIQRSGTIVWVQARFQDIPLKYVIAPDTPGTFLDFVLPSDVLTQELTRCVWCGQLHLANQVEQCPLKPN